jgi:hypothetical protein
MVLGGGSPEPPPPFLGFTALQVTQMFFALSSCVALTQQARDLAHVAHRVYRQVEGPLLATLELADLKNDLKPDDSSPLNVHYRELQLTIFRYRLDETPPGEQQQPSGSGTPDAGSMQVLPGEPPRSFLPVSSPIWPR